MALIAIVGVVAAVATIPIVLLLIPIIASSVNQPSKADDTANTILADNEIIAQTQKIPKVKAFLPPYPASSSSLSINVLRVYLDSPNNPEIYVDYSKFVRVDNSPDGLHNLTLRVHLAKDGTYASDAQSSYIEEHCAIVHGSTWDTACPVQPR